MKTQFDEQVKLLIDTLPEVAKEECFALKGGTAINLFLRDFPRMSVDIDITFIQNNPRNEALQVMEDALYRIKTNIEKGTGARVTPSSRDGLNHDIKLFVNKGDIQIKIEANPVIRGTLFPVEKRTLSPKVEKEYEASIEMQVVSVPDLYGGKIAAALDRQHPRDLFDIKILSENEGITEAIKDSFIVYLLSHKRPPTEIIFPVKKDVSKLFNSEFIGMTKVKFDYSDFEKTRDWLNKQIQRMLTNNDKEFLLKFFDGNPDWELFKYPEAKVLPAVQWKLQNLLKMDKSKRVRYATELKEKFGL
ncbi:MAG: nucleotidyl transferase AbiEii/AbiGii toxin family protein [Bdellovibrionales bacterium]|nr:nucleotidyl transferase AbiEii/AbiGii toxin family protein [Bdellovibrionales bacterium]